MNSLASPLVSQNHHTSCFIEPSRLHFIRSSPISEKHGRSRATLQTFDSSPRLRAHTSDKKYRILNNAQHKLVCRAAQESLRVTDDFYGVLGVSKDVNPPDLKRAYRKLALQVQLSRSWFLWFKYFLICALSEKKCDRFDRSRSSGMHHFIMQSVSDIPSHEGNIATTQEQSNSAECRLFLQIAFSLIVDSLPIPSVPPRRKFWPRRPRQVCTAQQCIRGTICAPQPPRNHPHLE